MTQDTSPAKPKAPPKSARRRARELALQGLYQWLLNRNDPGVVEAHLHDAQGFNKADRAHFDALLHGAIREEATLTESFTPFLDRPVAELSPVERAALLVGAYELVHCVDIPYKVVINEAVELAKTFGGVEGYKYVNGVLDKLAAQVRAAEVAARR
ncbi:transcription antitermination factor NusB (plasmid) [Ralstonia syzygii subsp. celebesensis]|uniref:Transcription antitermination protein NusB n=5 Tax=Ralstonia solanacearum species complex TaxID=3116862 RepID=A0AAD0SB05_RALSL|nr:MULTISPECIES: transcription antitermination factor NusB [Ralstonia solanacearum species complex]CAH0444118.1 Transcription antitermination protein NusB [Ralstonia syzygii subsp. syzygii]CCA82413.1 antitermination factor (N utilization substance B) (transcriptional antiterminator) [blood disease bacterium R229]AMP39164.1 N utilization substance protein B [Ralstonia solanacearum]AQW32758.1 N utilization substance protein B [blood disease bacterium A2-HR MARDI]AXV78566.1 transcription antiterm